ncbi:MAG: hypothetical protein J3K34DRAFT_518269 [Monoraphidium minutum]|nr:MAG: hypothetical protein J3K34DRAFT_518269 [Monoraphidium minutum]
MELEDLNGELIFEGEEGLWPSGDAGSDEDGEESPRADPPRTGTTTTAGVDIVAGTSVKSASIQSSTLRASLDEMQYGDADAGLLGGAGERHRLPFAPVAASLPARPSAVMMGSSVPIAIPPMARWKPSETPPAGAAAAALAAPGAAASCAVPAAAGAGAAPAAGRFVPPHQLTQHDDFQFSFNGASPSAGLKRERLRARNAILRSTGFLEPKPGGEGGGGGGLAIPGAAGGEPGGGSGGGGVAQSLPVGGMLRFEQQRQQLRAAAAAAHAPSSLTAALTTIGEAP